MVAERGNADPQQPGGFQDGRTQGNLDRIAVDGELNHAAGGLRLADRLESPHRLALGGPPGGIAVDVAVHTTRPRISS